MERRGSTPKIRCTQCTHESRHSRFDLLSLELDLLFYNQLNLERMMNLELPGRPLSQATGAFSDGLVVIDWHSERYHSGIRDVSDIVLIELRAFTCRMEREEYGFEAWKHDGRSVSPLKVC